MSTNSTVTVRVRPGLPALLTVLFVALKLLGVIAWSWVWVLSPLWIALGLGLVALAVAVGLAVAVTKR